MKGVPLIFFLMKGISYDRDRISGKNEPWFEDKGQFLFLQNFKCIRIGKENVKSLSDCVLLDWFYVIRLGDDLGWIR